MAKGQENLIPMSERSKEEARELGQKGGVKSGEVRKQRRTFKEALEWYLDMEFLPDSDKDFELKKRFPALTNQDRLNISMIEAATEDKDVRAAVFVRDTIGEMPTQKMSVDQEKPFEIMIKTVE